MKKIIEVEIGFPKSIVQYEGEPITTMISTAKGILTLNLKLDFIFNHKTQNELAIEICITQWELLQKIKDYSFDKKQLTKISKLYRELYLKDKRSNVL